MNMKGAETVGFLELFTDTINNFGIQWAFQYYVKKMKMDIREFRFWCRQWYRV